jgi:hypothetical protein
MADLAPTYYNVEQVVSGSGMSMSDLHKILWNLYKAVQAIPNNLDEDSGTLGTDYLANIGTDLDTAMAKLQEPTNGPVT